MKNKQSFLKCDVCGNITAAIDDSVKKMTCCDKEMTLAKCRTTEFEDYALNKVACSAEFTEGCKKELQ